MNCSPGVLPWPRVEPEEGDEEGEQAAEDEEDRDEQEVDGYDLKVVNGRVIFLTRNSWHDFMSLLKESLESIESLSILYLEEVDAVEAH